jgi:hypothetical protein
MIIIAALLGISVLGILFSRVHPIAKAAAALLLGLGVLALLWLVFLLQLEGMGGD